MVAVWHRGFIQDKEITILLIQGRSGRRYLVLDRGHLFIKNKVVSKKYLKLDWSDGLAPYHLIGTDNHLARTGFYQARPGRDVPK